MTVYETIMNRRSIRKFAPKAVGYEDLTDLVRAASFAAYPANLQPLKFAIVTEDLDAVFACTKWAGYLKDGAPKAGERPTAYLAILGDKTIKQEFGTEVGAAGMTILLAAEEKGLASCWLGALNRERLSELLALPPHLELLDMIALGYGAQKSVAEVMQDGNLRYYEDADGVIHVPKRSMDEVLWK